MCCDWCDVRVFFFFKQKTAYELRISDWSSDVCSSDLGAGFDPLHGAIGDAVAQGVADAAGQFQRAAGKGFEFAHGGGLMMTVLANSLAVAALNRREREARVLNAGSFMHGRQARRVGISGGPPVTSPADWRGGGGPLGR